MNGRQYQILIDKKVEFEVTLETRLHTDGTRVQGPAEIGRIATDIQVIEGMLLNFKGSGNKCIECKRPVPKDRATCFICQ